MTLREFETANADILLGEIGPAELLAECTDGASFFLVTVARSNKPRDAKTVLQAGYAMACRHSAADGSVTFLAMTASEKSKLQPVYEAELSDPGSYHHLYRTKPLAANDPRRGKPWTAWPTDPRP